MIKLLSECKVDTKEVNNGGLTALNILEMQSSETPNREICLTMIRTGKTKIPHERAVRRSERYFNRAALHEKLRFTVTLREKIVMGVTGKIVNMSAGKINAVLVVLTLILTATCQAINSPPRGVWQGEYSANTTSAETHVGQSVMQGDTYWDFFTLYFLVFIYTSVLTVGFLQLASGSRFIAILFEILLSLLTGWLVLSAGLIAPSTSTKASGHVESNTNPSSIAAPLIIFLFIGMEFARWGFLRILNPTEVKFYRKFIRQM